jgi:hypothetical protein
MLSKAVSFGFAAEPAFARLTSCYYAVILTSLIYVPASDQELLRNICLISNVALRIRYPRPLKLKCDFHLAELKMEVQILNVDFSVVAVAKVSCIWLASCSVHTLHQRCYDYLPNRFLIYLPIYKLTIDILLKQELAFN